MMTVEYTVTGIFRYLATCTLSFLENYFESGVPLGEASLKKLFGSYNLHRKKISHPGGR